MSNDVELHRTKLETNLPLNECKIRNLLSYRSIKFSIHLTFLFLKLLFRKTLNWFNIVFMHFYCEYQFKTYLNRHQHILFSPSKRCCLNGERKSLSQDIQPHNLLSCIDCHRKSKCIHCFFDVDIFIVHF